MDWGDLCSEDDLVPVGKGGAVPPEMEDGALTHTSIHTKRPDGSTWDAEVPASIARVQWTGHPAEYLRQLPRPEQLVIARAAGQVSVCADWDYDKALDAVVVMCMAYGRMMYDTIVRCDRAAEVEAKITAQLDLP